MPDTIQRFMSHPVSTIAIEQTLADAHLLMNAERIRHLPVLRDGELAGMVSQRDLHLVETLDGVNPTEVRVEEAMTRDVYVVAPHTPLRTVAREMARRKCGSAVVATGGELVGIFTTVDALRALAALLDEREGAEPEGCAR